MAMVPRMAERSSSCRLSTGTVSVLRSAASMAARSASSWRVVAAAVVIRAAPVGVCTHQASAVRRIDTVILSPWIVVGARSSPRRASRGGWSGRIRCRHAAR